MRPLPRQHSLRQLVQAAWPALLALLVTFVVYRDVSQYDFVNYDDDLYVYENPHVTGGLSPGAIRWAFSNGQAGVWIPATWLSFQLDASLYGAGPAGFHRTNLLLHLLNVLLVFLVVRRLTGTQVGAALAAAVFGVHPVNVEAVAWVTARKDLLMTSFLLGAVLAWLSMRVGAVGLWPAPWPCWPWLPSRRRSRRRCCC